MSLDGVPLESLVIQCSGERTRFRQTGDPVSPGCAEIFRRAVREDQAAIVAIRAIFEPLMRAWIKPWRFGEEDVDDVMQEGFWDFIRSVSRHREYIENDDLRRVLGLWETCVKRACIHVYRKNRKRRLDAPLTGDEPLPPAQQSIETRIVLRSRLAHVLKDQRERLVVWSRLMLGFTPKQILERYPAEFRDITEVNRVLQRSLRRLRKDTALRDLYGPPAAGGADALSMSVLPPVNPHEAGVDTLSAMCHLDSDILWAYALGDADPSLKAEVERAPACLAAARAIIDDINQMEVFFQASACPPPDLIVEYHDQELTGTEFLLLDRHVRGCPLCSADIAVLAEMGAGPYTAPEPAPRWRIKPVITALYRSPLKQSLLGSAAAQYETDRALINIALQKPAGPPRTWTLVGEIRQRDGLPFQEAIQSITVAPGEHAEPQDAGAFDSHGGFMVENLAPGVYALTISTAHNDIVIESIAIGDPT